MKNFLQYIFIAEIQNDPRGPSNQITFQVPISLAEVSCPFIEFENIRENAHGSDIRASAAIRFVPGGHTQLPEQ
jgi:hypothetical protein